MIAAIRTPPKISIITVTYNRAAYLPYAIESARQQTVQDWELLIVDDGSTDATPQVVRDYAAQDPRIRYIRHEDRTGIARNRNSALREALGTYIAVLDSDDLWCSPDKLEKQLAFLDTHTDHVLIGTGVIEIDRAGNERRRYLNPKTDKDVRNSILCRNPFAHSSVMFDRALALELGGYDERYAIGEDYDLMLRLGMKGSMANLPEHMLCYRIHPGSICITDRITSARATRNIIARYQDQYPHYGTALLKSYLRTTYMYLRQCLSTLKGRIRTS